MKSARLSGVVGLAAALLVPAACTDRGQAVGTVSSIIVITTDSLWAAIGDSVQSAMEPRIFTVRDERSFEVTHVSPQDSSWPRMRQFRQVLVIGTAQDGWVEPVLREARALEARAPALIRTNNVWARNQFATALVVPPQNSAEAALAQVPQLAALTDSLFRAYTRERMYTSRPDTVLRDSLRSESGYGILLPNVYRSVRRTPDMQLFQNSTQIGGDLVRSVLVSARPGLLAPTVELARSWRDSIARLEYRPPHSTEQGVQSRSLVQGGREVVEVQGAWVGDDPTWPLGGPWVARVIPCPAQNRTFLLDAWLYAPARPKYEYMIQLQTILDTFECVAERAAAPRRRGGVRYAAAPRRRGGVRYAAAQP